MLLYKSILILFFINIICLPLRAQDNIYTWEMFCQEYANDVENSSMEVLEELHQNPLNINTVNKEQLLELGFLTSQQADSIISYRKQYGYYHGLGELVFIKNVDCRERNFLSLFLYCINPYEQLSKSFWTKLSKGRVEASTTLGIPLYQRAGYHHYSDSVLLKSPNKIYLGNALQSTVRFRYKYQNELSYGFVGKKDAGEPFMYHGNYPFDSNSFHVWYHVPKKPFFFLLGDYRVNAGLGLVVGSSFVLSKSTLLTSTLNNQPAGFSISQSTNLSSVFRGFASSMSWGQHGLTFWLSRKKCDANLKNDTITSFKTDGMHRTSLEISKKDNTNETLAGIIYEFAKKNWSLGCCSAYTHYDRMINPKLTDYSLYYFRGKEIMNYSTFGSVNLNGTTILTETSFDSQWHNASTIMVSQQLAFGKILGQYRNFSKSYQTFYGKTLQESSHIRNEEGLLFEVLWKIDRRWSSSVYVDAFRFKKPTFNASKPSKGLEMLLQLDLLPSNKSSLSAYLKYRFKAKQYDIPQYTDILEYKYNHKIQLNVAQSYSDLCLNEGIELIGVSSQTERMKFGCLCYGRINYKLKKFALASSLSLFATSDYDARVYLYEPSLKYSYGFTSLYGKGCKVVVMASSKPKKWISFNLKYAGLFCFNRKQIGSGTQTINSCCQNDIIVQTVILLSLGRKHSVPKTV